MPGNHLKEYYYELILCSYVLVVFRINEGILKNGKEKGPALGVLTTNSFNAMVKRNGVVRSFAGPLSTISLIIISGSLMKYQKNVMKQQYVSWDTKKM